MSRVIDGDTFQLAHDPRRYRLLGLDAPERGQPGYRQARKELARRALGRQVRMQIVAHDKFDRPLVRARVTGL